MLKRIIPYMLFVAGVLTACQTDYFEPDPAPQGAGEALTLTISASDVVVAGGTLSRAADIGKATAFDVNDRAGLIIVDKDGYLLVDNLPYKFDGSKWNIDTEKAGVDQIYFDGTMTDYIVYYPYDESVTGCKSIPDIKALPVFEISEDQSDELKFRFSDLMACTGKVTRQIEANLGHLRNCFCLDPKIKCKLNNGETITFRPKRYLFSAEAYSAPRFRVVTTGFDEFKIAKDREKLIDYDVEYNPEDTGKLYIAEDGSYRYILPKEKKFTFKWHYFYRGGKTYGGEYTIEPREDEENLIAGRRFLFDETTDIGDFSDKDRKEGEKLLQVNDYFCHDERTNVGYPFPCEALDLLDDHPCLGVIFKLGLHSTEDASKDANVIYTDAVYANDDHGYVVALTDAPDENLSFKKLQWRTTGENELIGPLSQNMETYSYWSGYKYLSAIREHVEDDAVRWRNFPAAYACEQYGNRIPEMTAPDNTSGWFLPTMYQLAYISGYRGPNVSPKVDGANESNSFITRNHILTQRIATVRRKLPDTCGYKANVTLYYPLSEQPSAAHWGSETYSETVQYDKDDKETGRTYIFTQAEVQNLMGKDINRPEKTKTAYNYVRAVLAF